MKLSVLFFINAILAALFGLAFLIAPRAVITQFGGTVDPSTEYLGRVIGSLMIGFAVLSWMARNSDRSVARDAIVLGVLVTYVIGFLAGLLAQLSGVGNSFGWVTVVLNLLMALAFGYAYQTQSRGRVRASSRA